MTDDDAHTQKRGSERGDEVAKPIYMRFEVPKELVDKTYEVVELSRDTGKVRKGVNEVTKIIERGEGKLVVMSTDVQPEEILAHIPMLCEEKNTPYGYVPSKQELGKASGLKVPTASVVVIDPGKGKAMLEEVAGKLRSLGKKVGK